MKTFLICILLLLGFNAKAMEEGQEVDGNCGSTFIQRVADVALPGLGTFVTTAIHPSIAILGLVGGVGATAGVDYCTNGCSQPADLHGGKMICLRGLLMTFGCVVGIASAVALRSIVDASE